MVPGSAWRTWSQVAPATIPISPHSYVSDLWSKGRPGLRRADLLPISNLFPLIDVIVSPCPSLRRVVAALHACVSTHHGIGGCVRLAEIMAIECEREERLNVKKRGAVACVVLS